MKEDLNILLTENDHVAKNRSTLITSNESDDEKIQRQSIALRHKTTNAMKLTAMISHQFNVVRASQQSARLMLLTSAELFRHELSFICHQQLSTISCN